MPLTIDYRPFELPAEPAPAAPPLRATRARPRRRSGAIVALAALVGFGSLGWSGLTFEPAAARASAPPTQPFETPGETFPGSAFYYLEADSGVVPAAPRGSGAAAPRPLDAAFGDATARPTFLAGSAEDRFRALHCLTTAIYYEAATEPDAGQRAVAQVVLNRVAHPQWPNSVCGVVFQGSERPGCQFSFACDGSMARAPARGWWLRARAVAERALAGEVYAPVGLATYYHTGAVHPAWADRMAFVGAIGAHLFYRPPGAEGRASAFADRYFGAEPSPAPRPALVIPRARPVALAPIAGPGRPSTPSAALAPAAPAVPDLLPPASTVRAEYRNSGRWIAAPKG